MYVKPVYLRRLRVRCNDRDTHVFKVQEVSPETRPIGFNPTATVTNQIVIAR
jgi:hypothetical protein